VSTWASRPKSGITENAKQKRSSKKTANQPSLHQALRVKVESGSTESGVYFDADMRQCKEKKKNPRVTPMVCNRALLSLKCGHDLSTRIKEVVHMVIHHRMVHRLMMRRTGGLSTQVHDRIMDFVLCCPRTNKTDKLLYGAAILIPEHA